MEYNNKTVSELRKLCKDKGIVGYSKEKKATLIRMLETHDEKSCDDKLKYIKGCKKGTIIAFLVDGKAKSAKIIKKSSKERVLKCIASYGKEFIVSFDDVIWVKTGTRWPRGVYNQLKGICNNENEEKKNKDN